MNLFSNLDPLKRFSEQYNQRTKLTISLSIFGVIIFILIATMLPFKDQLFSNLYPKPKSEAQEIKQDQKPPKPEYVQGEVLVKFRTLTSLEVKKEKKSQGIDLDKAAVAFADLEERSIPPVIENIHQKHKVKQIEKVFKGAGSPQEELTKFKKKFASEIAAGKRKINESELLKIDLSRTFKLIFEDDTIPIEQLIQELAQNPEVEYAEPNFIFKTQQKRPKPPKSSPTPTPLPTPTPTPIPTPTPTPLPCTLTSASWSTATAVEGSGVGLDVGGTGCAGKTVSFEVRRFGSTPLDDIPANIQPSPVVLNAFGVGSGTWIAEYNPLIPGTDPDYYFKATVTGGNTIDNKTALLTITQAPTPAPIPSGPTPTPAPTASPPPTSLWPNDPYFQDPNPVVQERSLPASSGGWNPLKQDNSPLDYQWDLKKIGFPEAWNYATPSANTIVAVIDTGVDYNHSELQGKIWENQGEVGTDSQGQDKKNNGIDDDNNGYIDDWRGWDALWYLWQDLGGGYHIKLPDNDPMDDAREPYFDEYNLPNGGGHGTHVSGTIAGSINNTIGIAGINDTAKIMALRGLGADGKGFTEDLSELLYYASVNGAKVINMSWGSPLPSQVLEDSLLLAYNSGVTLVAAAGNSGYNTIKYPAAYSQVISVSATNEEDQLAGYSSYGSKIDLSAPGGDGSGGRNPYSILSLRANQAGITIIGIDQKYGRAAGTSMASPHVAGLASLILSKNPLLSNDQVKAIMEYSADDLGVLGKDEKYGHGRINVLRAMKEFSFNPPPIVSLTEPFNQEHLYSGTFTIKGTASSDQFRNFRLEYTPLDNPNNWSTNGISLATASSTGITNGALGSWDSGQLEGKYYLKLTASDQEARERSYQVIVELINQSKKTGWPVSFGSYDNPARSDPIVADLDNDGKKEIVLSTLDKIIVYRENGQIMSGWPVTVNSRVCSSYVPYPCYIRNSSLVVGNIDPTSPNKEIITNEIAGSYDDYQSYNKVKIFRSDGSVASTIDRIMTWGVAADVNGDGVDEILDVRTAGAGSSMSWTLHAYNLNGQEASGFPVQFYQNYGSIGTGRSNIRIGDLDGDKKDDVVIVISGAAPDNPNVLTTISGTGQILWSKNLHTGYAGYYDLAPFVLADLNSDGKKEVIFYDTYSLSQSPWYAYDLYVFKGDGSNLFSSNPLNLSDVGMGTMHVVDTNNDTQPEILIISSQKMAVIHNTGSINLSDIPTELKVKPGGFNIAIGDIDKNNAKDFVVNNTVPVSYVVYPPIQNSMFSILEYQNNNFIEKAGWPKSIIADMFALGGNGSIHNPAIADSDNDGKVEIILQYCLKRQNNCYIQVLQAGQVGYLDWPQYLHDERHTGAYSAPTPTPTPTPSLGLFISPSSVNTTITSGSSVKVFDLTSTGAGGFQFYGYPTSYGPGINWTPQSGGITTGSTMPINIEVMTTVSAGTYQGTGTLMNLQGQQMNIPVTINVVQPTPTPTPIPTPVPRLYKYVFLTSATYNGNLGNLTGADQKCQTLANNVSKLSSSTFMAWLSNSSNSPNSRFLTKSSQAYMLVEDTTKIADNWTDLTDNSIDAPINKDENGSTVAAGSEVWTNTSASGGIVNITTDSNCNNWTTDDGLNYGVYVGANNYSSNTWWTIYNYRTCNGTRRLYCFEQ